MKKRDWIVILLFAAMAVGLLVWGLASRDIGRGTETGAQDRSAQEMTEEADGASDYSESVRAEAAAYLAEHPADSYLLLTTSQNVYSPIPLAGDDAFRITQADGSENVIHIGKDSFYMESSNCDNQNCVNEGEVTLENRRTRILYNMVVCLPHQLSLELLTPDEAEAVLLELYEKQEAAQTAITAAAAPSVAATAEGNA